jgi:periplasmic protein CpxP/Spy
MHKSRFSFALSSVLLATMTGGIAWAQTASPAQPQPATHAAPQPGGSVRAMPSAVRQLSMLTRMLDLSPDQQNQLRPILADRQQHLQAISQDASLSARDRLAKSQSVRQESNGKIEAVLNDQQKQDFQKMVKHERDRHRAQRPGAATQPPQQ